MTESKENYEIIEINHKYYHYNEKIIQEIIAKDPTTLNNEEWYTLIQMLYPGNMIGSGLFQPILIFRVGRNGKRIDPPIEAYNSINSYSNKKCLYINIMDYILNNSKLSFNNLWYEMKEKILTEVTNGSNKNANNK